jgi:hypothetical protein
LITGEKEIVQFGAKPPITRALLLITEVLLDVAVTDPLHVRVSSVSEILKFIAPELVSSLIEKLLTDDIMGLSLTVRLT